MDPPQRQARNLCCVQKEYVKQKLPMFFLTTYEIQNRINKWSKTLPSVMKYVTFYGKRQQTQKKKNP